MSAVRFLTDEWFYEQMDAAFPGLWQLRLSNRATVEAVEAICEQLGEPAPAVLFNPKAERSHYDRDERTIVFGWEPDVVVVIHEVAHYLAHCYRYHEGPTGHDAGTFWLQCLAAAALETAP